MTFMLTYFEFPLSKWIFAPEMDREERPLLKNGGKVVPGTREQKNGSCSRRRGQSNHDVPSGIVPQGDLALHVFQEPHVVKGSNAAVRVHCHGGRPSHCVRD